MTDVSVQAGGVPGDGEGLSVKHRVILKEIERIENPRTGMVQKLLLLLFSVVIFIQMQVITGSAEGIVALLVVLFVHELGHLAAMKLSGYSNVQMFFIPLFGAAVSGRETKPDAARKAVVSLMGPLPGIVIGFAALYLFSRTGIAQFREYGDASLLINILNLLPFYPLDGGQFFDSLLFSRRPGLDIFFKILGALGLGLLAVASASVLIGILAVLVLVSVRSAAVTARVAKALRKEGYAAPVTGSVPEEFVADVSGRLEKAWKSKSIATKNLANQIIAVWNRVRMAPPKPGQTAAFISLYVTAVFGSIILWVVMMWSMPLGDGIQMTAFTSRDGGFTVNMPSEPRYEKQARNEAGIRTEMHFFHSRYFRTEFSVFYFDLPAAAGDARPATTFRFLSEDTAARLKGRIMDDHPVALGAYPGKGITMSLPDGMYLVSRMYLAGRRVYKLSVVTPEGNRGSKVIRNYIDSFALTGERK